MSQGVIIGIAFLAIFIIGGPIAKAMGSHSPLIGVIVGVVVYIFLSAVYGRQK